MIEQRSRAGERVLVCYDGQWYDVGARVRLGRKPSTPGQLALTADPDGDREVLICARTVMSGRPMLVVTLRRV